jgi:hypothetical protein
VHPRWFAVLAASCQAKKTTWMAITWACALVLAISLLLGLMVGACWHACCWRWPWLRPAKHLLSFKCLARFSSCPLMMRLYRMEGAEEHSSRSGSNQLSAPCLSSVAQKGCKSEVVHCEVQCSFIKQALSFHIPCRLFLRYVPQIEAQPPPPSLWSQQ